MNDHDVGRWVDCEECEGLGVTRFLPFLDVIIDCLACDGQCRVWLPLEEEVKDGVG
jgi:hypothetical protein